MTSDPDAVTIWTMAVGTCGEGDLAGLRALLGPEEILQAGRFRIDADRHAYIAAHALMRRLVEAVGGHDAALWQFGASSLGKPEIVGPGSELGIEISHTHTRGLVACAAAMFPVGIDAECLDRAETQPGIARAILAPDEIALLDAAPPERRHELFLRLWTLREAYVKATGAGIRYPREEFSFALDPPRIRFMNDDDDGACWQFLTWREGRHLLALAARCDAKRPIVPAMRAVGPDELS